MRHGFRLLSINVSARVGVQKKPVASGRVTLREDHGIVGDAHARNWHRLSPGTRRYCLAIGSA